MADITRLEQFLNHIAHPEDPIPAPQTRLEQNLVEIAENKGGGGGGGDVFVVETNPQTHTLDKTWQEIYDAVASGKVAYILNVMPNVAIMAFPVLYIESSSFAVATFEISASGTAMVVFAAASADDYPVLLQD